MQHSQLTSLQRSIVWMVFLASLSCLAGAIFLPAPARAQIPLVIPPLQTEVSPFSSIENGIGQISDALSEKFADLKPSYVHIVYARDFQKEQTQRVAALAEVNDLLSRTNDNMFGLYTKSLAQFGAAAAFDADAAKVIADGTMGAVARAQANLSISAAAAIDEAYNALADALASKTVSGTSISVASVAYAPDLTLTLNLSL